jgi:hemolysin activation/secretion protein
MFAMTVAPSHVPATASGLVVPAGAALPGSAAPPLEVESHGFRYAVTGNSLLSPTEVATTLQGGATPAAAIGALKQAYARAGYFLVAVVATVQERQVSVRVVQGRLVEVDGPAELAAYFRRLEGQDTLRNSDVVRQGLLAQAYAATNGERPQISFRPAAEAGGSAMRIGTVPLADSHAVGGGLTVGNLGNRYAGHDLAQVQGQLQHDGVSVQATHSRALTGVDPHSRGAWYAATSATLSVVAPLGWFQLDGGTTRYRLGTAFAPLDPAGTIKVRGGSATQLLYADDARRWTLAEAAHRIDDRETVFDGVYTLRDQRYDVFDVSSQASWHFDGLAHRTASASLSGAVKLGGDGSRGFAAGQGMPTAHFRVYTVHVGLNQALARGYGIQFDASAQGSPDTLPPYEQWVLGGLAALAAYLPGTLVGDCGYLGRVTVQAPQWRIGAARLRPGAFAEYGATRYRYVPADSPAWQSLDDVGASLSLDLPAIDAHAMVAYAKPLGARHVPTELRHRQQAHAFVYLQLDF